METVHRVLSESFNHCTGHREKCTICDFSVEESRHFGTFTGYVFVVRIGLSRKGHDVRI